MSSAPACLFVLYDSIGIAVPSLATIKDYADGPARKREQNDNFLVPARKNNTPVLDPW